MTRPDEYPVLIELLITGIKIGVGPRTDLESFLNSKNAKSEAEEFFGNVRELTDNGLELYFTEIGEREHQFPKIWYSFIRLYRKVTWERFVYDKIVRYNPEGTNYRPSGIFNILKDYSIALQENPELDHFPP